MENGGGIKFTDARAADLNTRPRESTDLTQFEDDDDMVSKAEKKYRKANLEEAELDKTKGFDIESIESIRAFDVGYTPMGNTVLIKIIREEHKIGLIIIPDGTALGVKAVVVVPGLYVNNLLLGDIVMLKGESPSKPIPPHIDRKFKDVNFWEVPFEAIAGAFVSREKLITRIGAENKILQGEKN